MPSRLTKLNVNLYLHDSTLHLPPIGNCQLISERVLGGWQWQQRTDSTGMMVLAQSRRLSSRYLRDTARYPRATCGVEMLGARYDDLALCARRYEQNVVEMHVNPAYVTLYAVA